MKTPDPLERVIRPIVEGQIRGFIKEHPSILKGVDWYKPRTDKAVTLTNSLTKRIVRDLLCLTVRARLAAAIVELQAATPPNSSVDFSNCGEGGALGSTSERPAPTGRPFNNWLSWPRTWTRWRA